MSSISSHRQNCQKRVSFIQSNLTIILSLIHKHKNEEDTVADSFENLQTVASGRAGSLITSTRHYERCATHTATCYSNHLSIKRSLRKSNHSSVNTLVITTERICVENTLKPMLIRQTEFIEFNSFRAKVVKQTYKSRCFS
jgi:3-deoxy-D-manno-octulosonic-acid transferase